MDNMESKIKSPVLWYWFVFIIYIVLRSFAWSNTVLLEGHDSVFLLYDIRTFLTFDLKEIINMRADSTPIYPFFGALCSLPGWSAEFGARLCSMVFSSLLFLCLALIGQRIARPVETLLGLFILSLSPIFIPLSYSILTEMSYFFVCYLGLLFLLSQHKHPKFRMAALLGIIFGLSFLARTEGFLYVAVIPFIQGAHYLFFKPRKYTFRRLAGWVCIYILAFSIIAAPQIWRVSHKMGHLAINGRQVWNLILKNDDGKTYSEKISGLDYSPKQINLYYIQEHPEVSSKFISNAEFSTFFRNILYEFNELYQKNLGILIGPFGIAFFAFGLLAMYRRGLQFECFVILSFIGFALVAPLIHNVAIRHIAIIAPLIMLVEGMGIIYLSKIVLESHGSSSKARIIVPLTCLFAVTGSFLFPLKHLFLNQPQYNIEYNPAIVRRASSIIRKHADNASLEPSKIAAKQEYLAYYAGMEGVHLPFSDYEKLVRYCALNNVGYMLFEYRPLKTYPYYKRFLNKENITEFELLHREIDGYGQPIEIYYFNKT